MTHKRYMAAPATERRIMNGALWLVAACVIVAILTSCSSYAAMSARTDNSPTPSPITATVTAPLMSEISDTPTPPPPACTVTGFLNFRTSPSRRAAVIRVLEAGERVTVLEAGDWLKVSTRDRTGFIYSAYCR